MSNKNKHAIIIGAGPAGLTAAYELLQRTDIKPIILEATNDIGGISKTVRYKGNRIDIGGHRFFSKSDRVMEWWKRLFPIQGAPAIDDKILGRTLNFSINGPDPDNDNNVLLLRNRVSRIYFLRKFFDYPVSLSLNTIKNLGVLRFSKVCLSYIWSKIFPRKNEIYLESFFINRFGRVLYQTFFENYTEKVWGLHPSKIKADWGAQRVKGLSITTVILHAIKSMFPKIKILSFSNKPIETSLIDEFLYPKYGPGQLWEYVAETVIAAGGEVRTGHQVVGIEANEGRISKIVFRHSHSDKISVISDPDYVFSSMPIKDLIGCFNSEVPEKVRKTASGLAYRDFLTVGLLLRKLIIKNETKIKTLNDIIPDNWIYIQEEDVRVGRLQIFNNWSPYMVDDSNTVWIGMEYFCTEGDEIWSKSDENIKSFAIDELSRINIIDPKDILDSVVVKIPKAYPAYFGTYDDFDHIKDFTNEINNLFLIGRNGQHRYNNSDHSMACAMEAVDNIVSGRLDKNNIWSVNTEQEYHELKARTV